MAFAKPAIPSDKRKIAMILKSDFLVHFNRGLLLNSERGARAMRPSDPQNNTRRLAEQIKLGKRRHGIAQNSVPVLSEATP